MRHSSLCNNNNKWSSLGSQGPVCIRMDVRIVGILIIFHFEKRVRFVCFVGILDKTTISSGCTLFGTLCHGVEFIITKVILESTGNKSCRYSLKQRVLISLLIFLSNHELFFKKKKDKRIE